MKYPDWLVNTLVGFNHYATCMNEWELIDIAVDLHRQPDLPQRLNVLFESLQQGLTEQVLVAGNFVALGYYTDTGNRVFARFVEFGKKARAMRELRQGDDEAAVLAFEQATAEVKRRASSKDQRVLILQLPYFIKKVETYAPKGDITFDEFQRKFDQKEVIFSDILAVEKQTDVRNLLAAHPATRYEQRFLFTFGLLVTNGVSDQISQGEVQEALGYFIGSFLSWAGMGVADSTRYVMAAATARLAHYSHEFLKPFGELRNFLNTHASIVAPELQQKLGPVLAMVKLLELSSVAVGFNPDPYSFKELLKQALRNNTSFSDDQEMEDETYDLTLKIRDVEARNKVQITFEGLPENSVAIRFEPSFFDRLVRNLLRNAAQHSKADQPVRVHISVRLDAECGFLTLAFKHLDSKIPRHIARLLFRMPVTQSDSNVSKGIGLWTVGMAFEAQKLPLPEVLQEPDGASFLFRFPMAKQ